MALAEHVLKAPPNPRQRDPILWPARPGEARLDRSQVEGERVGVHRIRLGAGAKQALLLGVALDQLDLRGRPAGVAQVSQCLVVDREDRRGRPELGRHVGDRGTVGQRQTSDAGAVELDERPHHPAGTQQLGQRQHQVGGGHPGTQRAVQLDAEHHRRGHIQRLAEHHRLGLDPADTPPQHAQCVDHGRVRVGAHQRVGKRDAVTHLHDRGQILEVDLVDDAHPGRYDLKVSKRSLGPAKQRVALEVSLVLTLDIALIRHARTEGVDLD